MNVHRDQSVEAKSHRKIQRRTTYPVTAALIILMVTVILGFHKLENDEAAFKHEVHERTMNDCLQRQDTREVTKNIFTFLLNLAPNSNDPTVTSIRTYIDANLGPVECDTSKVIVLPATSTTSAAPATSGG